MPVDPVIAAYLRSVGEELDAVERLSEPPVNRLAPYHLQQASEKLTKALLLRRGLAPTVEHRISMLTDRLPTDDPWRVLLDPLDRFSQFATTYRYPTTSGRLKSAPESADLVAAVAEIRALLARALIECAD